MILGVCNWLSYESKINVVIIRLTFVLSLIFGNAPVFLMYFSIYLVMNLALFSCILMLKKNNKYYESIEDLSGLSRNHPLLAFSLLIVLFSLAGIPPLAGFFAKFYIFKSVLEQSMFF